MGKWKGQSNKVCFTVNNYTDAEQAGIIEHLNEWDGQGKVKYAVIGEECGDNGTLHLQGYIRLNRTFKKARGKCLIIIVIAWPLTG